MDKTAICNQALVEAEVDASISSVETDESIEAQRMRRIYDVTLDECLASYVWSFATKFVYLSPVSVPLNSPYSNAFAYPANARRINALFDGEQAVKDNMFSNDFTLSASDDGSSVVVLTDMATPIASVLVKVNEESLPVSFLRYFYLHLALKTAKMSGSSDIVKERIFNEIQLVENEARILFASLSNNKIYDDENYYVDVRS